jgi:choline dehydrogenase-like flavoprotein
MLVTMIPDAIDAGARLVFRARADRLEGTGDEITRVRGTLLDPTGTTPTGKSFTVTAKRFVVACGAINGPALLLRSGINENGRVGQRTFLHPVVASVGTYDADISPFRGAPQSAASHHFAHRGDEVGFFLEAAPWYPSLWSSATTGFGAEHQERFEQVKNSALHIAITIDGFHDDVPGGTVSVLPSGAPSLRYPIPDRIWRAFREAQKRMAEMAFASGAKRVTTLHDPALVMEWKEDIPRIDAMPYDVGAVSVFTAHVMGGCPMGEDPKTSVVRSTDLRHHTRKNLYVIDGSVFPTSLGVNPQESIYGLARLMATRLAAVK